MLNDYYTVPQKLWTLKYKKCARIGEIGFIEALIRVLNQLFPLSPPRQCLFASHVHNDSKLLIYSAMDTRVCVVWIRTIHSRIQRFLYLDNDFVQR